MNILLVDDEKELCELLEMSIKNLKIDGLNTDIVFDPKSALEKITNKDYDLIISDIKMPHMDGVQMCVMLHKNDQFLAINSKFLFLLCML